eukprot:1170506-Amphidinium_carterae.2
MTLMTPEQGTLNYTHVRAQCPKKEVCCASHDGKDGWRGKYRLACKVVGCPDRVNARCLH